MCVWLLEKGWSCTYNPVLDAEAQLVAKVRPPDQHGGHRRAPHDVQLHPGLVLQALKRSTDSTVDAAASQAGGRQAAPEAKEPQGGPVAPRTPQVPAVHCSGETACLTATRALSTLGGGLFRDLKKTASCARGLEGEGGTVCALDRRRTVGNAFSPKDKRKRRTSDYSSGPEAPGCFPSSSSAPPSPPPCAC